jgi:hypothetical protein
MNNNPNKKSSLSHTRAILAWMRAGNTINDELCRKKFHCTRLGARIKDIEKIVGYKPLRKFTEVWGFDAEGNPVKKHVMFYWLRQEDVEKA